MRIHLLIALVALVGTTAFAPAPFLKTRRHRERGTMDLLPQLQGTWSITSKVRTGPNGRQTNYSTSQQIQFEKDTFQYTYKNIKAKITPVPYKFTLDPGGPPARFRIQRTSTTPAYDYMTGIITVEGDTAKMMYRLGSTGLPAKDKMPTGFDVVPEGWYLMTLKRER